MKHVVPRSLGCLAVAGLLIQLPLQGEVVINEIMYHPPGDSDALQYIELHNSGTARVQLDGWAFTKGVAFDFPAGSAIESNSFVVICRNRAAFKGHFGPEIMTIGDFSGRLSHRGESVQLVSEKGEVVDEVVYSDRDGWPKSPDGYGASLERISPLMEKSDSIHGWGSSSLPSFKVATGTPGHQNDGFSPRPLPAVTRVEFEPQWPNIDEPVRVRVGLAHEKGIESVILSYWVASSRGEGVKSERPLKIVGNVAKGDIPGQSEGSLVRFQIRVQGKDGTVRMMPAESSLRPAYSFFAGNRLETEEIGHGRLINVRRMERGVDKFHNDRGRGTREPARGHAAFIHYPADGGTPSLYDFIRVTQRNGGFKLRFHSDAKHDGVSVLNILYEGKPRYILSEYLSFELFRRVGVPAPKAGHLRFTIDGREVGCFLTVEQPNRSFLKTNDRDADGNLYKLLWFGRGVVEQHEKKTNRHEGHDDVVQAVRGLKSLNGDEQWRYIQQHFNVAECASYYAANMCLSNWDGFFNNHYVYHDAGDTGKWEIYPWDEDKTWGDYDGAPGDYSWYSFPLTSGMDGDRSPSRGFSFFNRGPFGGTAWWRPPGHFSGPLLANSSFRKVFLAHLESICHESFCEPTFLPVIDGLEKRLLPEIEHRARIQGRNPASAKRQFHADIDSFRRQLKHRRTFILKELAGSR